MAFSKLTCPIIRSCKNTKFGNEQLICSCLVSNIKTHSVILLLFSSIVKVWLKNHGVGKQNSMTFSKLTCPIMRSCKNTIFGNEKLFCACSVSNIKTHSVILMLFWCIINLWLKITVSANKTRWHFQSWLVRIWGLVKIQHLEMKNYFALAWF